MTKPLLIIEDEPALATLYVQIFTMNGFQVDFALTLEDALDLLEQKTYAVCITDVYMGLNNAVETLLDHPAYTTQQTNFIIHSGDYRYEKYADSLKMSFCGKPSEIETFVDLVQQLYESYPPSHTHIA